MTRFDQALADRKNAFDIQASSDDALRWLDQVLDRNSAGYQASRVLHSIDVEQDILDLCAVHLGRSDEGPKSGTREYYLRRSWRFLLGNHALSEARCIERTLAELGDHWFWETWRWISPFYPRLGIAVIVGYLALLGASDFMVFLRTTAEHGGMFYVATLCGFLLVAFFVALGDVQRRVGRHLKRVLYRAARLFGYGISYAAVALALHLLKRFLLGNSFRLLYPLLLAAGALFAAFVVQLFARDYSIGEPM